MHPPPLGRVVGSIPDPFQGRTLEEHLVQHVLVAHESRRVPPVVVERHPLDEAYVHVAAESLIGHSNEVGQFVVVYPSHDHAIDLDPRTAGSVRSDPRMSVPPTEGGGAISDGAHHLVQPVPARYFHESIGAQRIETDVHARQSGIDQVVDLTGEGYAVGGHPDQPPLVDVRIVILVECPERVGDGSYERGKVRTQQRLPPRQSDLVHSVLHEYPHEAHDLLVGEKLRRWTERHALGGHAVLTSQVAPLGEGDSEVIVMPPVRVSQDIALVAGDEMGSDVIHCFDF